MLFAKMPAHTIVHSSFTFCTDDDEVDITPIMIWCDKQGDDLPWEIELFGQELDVEYKSGYIGHPDYAAEMLFELIKEIEKCGMYGRDVVPYTCVHSSSEAGCIRVEPKDGHHIVTLYQFPIEGGSKTTIYE